jgi:hypothetical protein
MDDVDQMEWNEYQRLERAIDARKKRIEALEKGSPLIKQRNFRYVLDYSFDYILPTETSDGLRSIAETPSPQIRSFIVKSEVADGKRTHFYVKSIEASYALLGSQALPDEGEGPGQRFFIGPDYRRNFFDFSWRIRDTGSDREWQNTALPSQLLLTGNVNPLLFGNGHCMLSGGTEVLLEIVPTFSGNLLSENIGEFGATPAIVNPKSHFLQVCFVGVEVLL